MKKKAQKKSHREVVEALSVLLASSYTLYLKTQNYHWNVRGPMFTTLHTLYEMQYTELAAAVDEIAERIRALDAYAPGSLAEFSDLSVVKEAKGHPAAKDMVRQLAQDQHSVTTVAGQVVEAAIAIADNGTADLATRRQQVHQKNAWMLESHLK